MYYSMLFCMYYVLFDLQFSRSFFFGRMFIDLNANGNCKLFDPVCDFMEKNINCYYFSSIFISFLLV